MSNADRWDDFMEGRPAEAQDRVVARAKADPEYRRMLMEDADIAARQEAKAEAAPALPPKPLHLPPGMTWRAHDAAGVGHLLPPGNDKPGLRYLCGGLPIAARFGWPVRQRCAGCVAALEEGRV